MMTNDKEKINHNDNEKIYIGPDSFLCLPQYDKIVIYEDDNHRTYVLKCDVDEIDREEQTKKEERELERSQAMAKEIEQKILDRFPNTDKHDLDNIVCEILAEVWTKEDLERETVKVIEEMEIQIADDTLNSK